MRGSSVYFFNAEGRLKCGVVEEIIYQIRVPGPGEGLYYRFDHEVTADEVLPKRSDGDNGPLPKA